VAQPRLAAERAGRAGFAGRSREPAGQLAQAERRDRDGRRSARPYRRGGCDGTESRERARAAGHGVRPARPRHDRGPVGASAVRSALVDALRSVDRDRDLTEEEAAGAVSAIMAGDASDAQIAAFLTALHVKGETAAELIGAARAVRARMAAWDPSGL